MWRAMQRAMQWKVGQLPITRWFAGGAVGLIVGWLVSAGPAPSQPPPTQPPPSQPTPTRPTGQPPMAKADSGTEYEFVVPPDSQGFIIDVTKAPYHAKGDGQADDTAALQRALNDHTGSRRIVYLPAGTYLVSAPLRWPNQNPKGQHVWGFCHLQGHSRSKTIIRLKDATFTDPKKPAAVISSGPHGSADWFHNFTCDLTIDTGRGNRGAVGLRFFSNNVGAVRRVAIVSRDGGGVTGLDLGFNDMNGCLLVSRLQVQGFAVGVRTGHVVNSQTFEHLDLRGQTECGFRNDGQAISIRRLHSDNRVPAVCNHGGLMVLLDSKLVGQGPATDAPAIINRGALYARAIKTTGYARAIDNHAGTKRGAAGPAVDEFTSTEPVSLFPSKPTALGLTIEETPTFPTDPLDRWASVVRFGADPTASKDSSAAIQKAIDSGATTVYFPTGGYLLTQPIRLRGAVRRLVGFNSVIDYNGVVRPYALEVQDGESPAVLVEQINPLGRGILHQSKRTLVVRDCELRGYAGQGGGDVYIENVVAGPWKFERQRVWARQLNAENKGTHVSNRGGQLWVLGYKTERGGTLIETTDGGKTQLEGGFSYTTEAGKLAPMFVCQDAAMTASFAEVCFNNDPFTHIVRETRRGETRELRRGDAAWKGFFTLYSANPN
jgi:hypothetical protein